jgi:hypothetical protein
MPEPEPDLSPPVEEAPSIEALAETVAETVEPADDFPRRGPRPAKPVVEKPKRSIAAAIGWLLLLLTAAGIGGAVFAQAEIMSLVPETRAIYRAFRFEVPPPGEGLEVAAPTAMRGSVAGTPTMEVRGKVRNGAARALPVPVLRVSLVDDKGAAVAERDLTLDATRLEPGEEAEFIVVFENPAPAAQSLTINFQDKYAPSW